MTRRCPAVADWRSSRIATLEGEGHDLRAENERLRTQLALRDQACVFGGEEVRRQKARAETAEAAIAKVRALLAVAHCSLSVVEVQAALAALDGPAATTARDETRQQ
jgi:hypothetical protein